MTRYVKAVQVEQVNVLSTGSHPVLPQPGLILIKPQLSSGTALMHELVTWWGGTFAVPLTSTQLTAIQSTFDTAFQNVFSAYGGTSATYYSCKVQDYSGTSGLSIDSNPAITGGATNGTLVPDNVAILVSWKVAERYKGGHGRWYLPCVGNSSVVAHNGVSNTIATAIKSQIDNLQTAMLSITSGNGGPFAFQIYRNRTGLTGSPHLLNTTSHVVQPILATQRRRMRKAPHH